MSDPTTSGTPAPGAARSGETRSGATVSTPDGTSIPDGTDGSAASTSDGAAAAPRWHTPVARSPIAPSPPVATVAGWEVSGRRAGAGLTLTDLTPLAKVQLKGEPGGAVEKLLGMRFGRCGRGVAGAGSGTSSAADTAPAVELTVGSGPGEWLLLGPPSTGGELAAWYRGQVAGAGELVSVVDLSHGRALVRLTGAPAPDVLAKLCAIDLSDEMTPDGSALRTSVAELATDLARCDAGGEHSYLLHCERSSGQYLFDALLDAGEEFGIEVDGFPADPPAIR